MADLNLNGARATLSQNISNVPVGDYTVTVSDASGADTMITVTVNQPDSLLITFTKTDNEYSEIPIGSIDLTVEGGTGSYSYAWTGPNGFTAAREDINQLEAGTYIVVVTDANGCQNTKEVVITRKNPNFIVNCPPPVEVPCMSDLPAAAITLQQFIAQGGFTESDCGIDSASFVLVNEETVTKDKAGIEIRRTYMLDDLCGFEETCTQVLIANDSIPPEAICNDITVVLDENGSYILTEIDKQVISAGSNDNCTAPEDLIIEIYPSEFTCTELGDIQFVNVIVTDEAGNQSTCVANVTVLDTVPPAAICRDITVTLDENGQAQIDANRIDNGSTDNCSIDTMFLSVYNFDCSDTGINTVNLTAIDKQGNSDVCTANVTIADTIKPVVTCVDAFELQLDENAQYTLAVNEIMESAMDECGIENLALSQYNLNCDDIGTTTIQLTATDVNGNSNSCETAITVYGNVAPIAQNDTIIIMVNETASVNVALNDYDIDNGTKRSVISSTVSKTMNPRYGKAEVEATSGIINYVPDKDFSGVDVVEYSICDDGIPCEPMCAKAKLVIYVLEPNMAPIAINDYFTLMCFSVTGDLLINDYDQDSDTITIDVTPVTNPVMGIVQINPDGTFIYEPYDKNFVGLDSFIYRIYDIGLPSLYDTAKVYIDYVSDYDCDGLANIDDIDDDNDGILDIDEMDFIDGEYVDRDNDKDGVVDRLDIDSDNDGIPDNIEWQTENGYIPPTGIDSNGNGWDNAYDPDNGGTYYPAMDTDGDGTPDHLDIDSDGDGVLDMIEGHDLDADGIPDTYPTYTDTDGDGLDDAYDTYDNWNHPSSPYNEVGSNAPLQDFDADGIRDWRDTNDDDDEWLTIDEDINSDGDYSNDDIDLDGHPEYLDRGTDCELFIPEGFSPNGDGIHDFFQVYCILKYPNAKMMIFDRAGNKLFEKEHYGNMDFWGSNADAWWWGTSEYKMTLGRGTLPAGNYVYVLDLGTNEVKKGTVMISY